MRFAFIAAGAAASAAMVSGAVPGYCTPTYSIRFCTVASCADDGSPCVSKLCGGGEADVPRFSKCVCEAAYQGDQGVVNLCKKCATDAPPLSIECDRIMTTIPNYPDSLNRYKFYTPPAGSQA